MAWAALEAMKDAGITDGIDQVFVANMGGGRAQPPDRHRVVAGEPHLPEPAMAEMVENGPHPEPPREVRLHGDRLGMADVALVVGGERMREVSGGSHGLRRDAHPPGGRVRLRRDAAGVRGMFTRTYMERYGLSERHLALLAVKAHRNARRTRSRTSRSRRP